MAAIAVTFRVYKNVLDASTGGIVATKIGPDIPMTIPDTKTIGSVTLIAVDANPVSNATYIITAATVANSVDYGSDTFGTLLPVGS